MRDRRTDRLKAPDVTDEAPTTAARALPNATMTALVQRLARTGRGPGGARAPGTAVAHDVSNQVLAASVQRLLAVDGSELGEMDPGLASSTQQQAESTAPPVPPLDTATGPSEATDPALVHHHDHVGSVHRTDHHLEHGGDHHHGSPHAWLLDRRSHGHPAHPPPGAGG